MLHLVRVNGIEDPVETQDRVNDHSEIVVDGPFVSELLSKEPMRSVIIAKTYMMLTSSRCSHKEKQNDSLQSIMRSQTAIRTLVSLTAWQLIRLTAVDRIRSSEYNKESSQLGALVDTIQTKTHGGEDCKGVFETIG